MMVELLAPAGSLDTVLAAIDAGADAIYLGGKVFNARKFAHNLDDEELKKAVETAHVFGVRIYVTVNIVMADKELKALRKYLVFLDSIHVDGIIVQDLAVAAIAREAAPNLPLHGSTQMTVADLDGVLFLASLGFTQAVLSRELSLTEIRSICSASPIPIEVFIHGAQCMSYSGQCLMSSFIGGRSGNRGACAQPCRLPYRLVKDEKVVMKDEKYMLSLKDLSSVDYIHALMDAGVASFKIEGRMKGNGYVRAVVGAYRKIMDSHLLSQGEQKEAAKEAQILLQGAFNRTYQHDFLTATVGRQTITEKASGNQGRKIGVATACHGNVIDAYLDEPLEPGDMVKICSDDGTEWIDEVQQATGSFTKKKAFTLEFRRRDLGIGTIFRLAKKGDRTEDSLGLTKKIALYGHLDLADTGCLQLTLWDEAGHAATVQSDFVPPLAQKRPATIAYVTQQLSRLGDTPFALADVTLWAEGYMLPASVLNQLRRDGAAAVETQILQDYPRPKAGQMTALILAGKTISATSQPVQVAVRCDTLEGIEAAGKGGANRVIFGGESFHHRPFTAALWQKAVALAKQYKLDIWAATPRIIKETYRLQAMAELQAAVQAGCDGIYIGAMSGFTMAKNLDTSVPLAADWSLNIFNSQAADVYHSLGCQGLTLSPEATLRQMEDIAKACPVPIEALVAGKIEMMVTEYCAIAAFAGSGKKEGCPAVCMTGHFALEDRKDNIFPIGTDQYCHNHILNSRDLDMVPYVAKLRRAGLAVLRVEGRSRKASWIEQQVSLYRRILDGTELMLFSKENKEVTRGHFFHGIL